MQKKKKEKKRKRKRKKSGNCQHLKASQRLRKGNAYQVQKEQKRFQLRKDTAYAKSQYQKKNTELQTLSFGINDKASNDQIGYSSRKKLDLLYDLC